MQNTWFPHSTPNEVSSSTNSIFLAQFCFSIFILTTSTNREHLYRHHALPTFQYHICYSIFRDSQELTQHLRPTEGSSQCPGPREQTAVGFTPEREHAFRRRQDNMSDEKRWNAVWRILFRGDNHALENIPSPCECFTKAMIVQVLLTPQRL